MLVAEVGGWGVGPMSGIQGVPMSQCIMGNGHMEILMNRMTDTSENMNSLQLCLLVVKITKWL